MDFRNKNMYLIWIPVVCLFSLTVPCFPTQKMKVVEPEQGIHYKNVHRYGETNIRHVDRPLRPEEWKKSARAQNSGRPLPATPRAAPAQERPRVIPPRKQPLQRQPPVESEEETETETDTDEEEQAPPTVRRTAQPAQQAPPTVRRTAQPAQPVKTDFFISVPIFNETLSHSYRKRNEYVYVDRGNEDTASLLHRSLSRSSSTKDLTYERPPSGASGDRSRRRLQNTNSSTMSHRSHSHDGRGHYTRQRPTSAHYANIDSVREREYSDRNRERPYSARHDTAERTYVNHTTSAYYNRNSDRNNTRERPHSAHNRDPRSARSSERRYYEAEDSRGVRPRRVLSDKQKYTKPVGTGQPGRADGQYSTHRGNYMYDEKPGRQHPRTVTSLRRRAHSGSEVSCNTLSSTGTGHSYIYEEMRPAFRMRKAPSTTGLEIDSDQDDTR